MSLNNDTTTHKTLLCGLLGKTLGHSFSPIIHSYLGDYGYRLFEKSEEELGEFLTNGDFHAINVTIPYKKAVIPFLSKMSDEAKRIGSVNTVIRLSDGSLFGDNTDYFGFSCLVRKSKIDIKGKKAIILGNGGASLTVKAVLCDMGAKSVTVISRSGEDNYTNLSRHADAQIIVNTTPVGMYPNNGSAAINLADFSECVAVFDLIYNPARTALMLEADRLSIPNYGGLLMLVAQAKRAAELFTDTKIDDMLIDEITSKLLKDTQNIVLVGMPGSGKSTLSKMLAEKLGREFIDTDEEILKREIASGRQRSIPDIFTEEGESGFREIESQVISDIAKQSRRVIATGGGAVTQSQNYDALKQNSVIFFIDRPTELLPTDGRPLSQSSGVSALYEARLPLYISFSDIRVKNICSPEETVHEIISKFNSFNF